MKIVFRADASLQIGTGHVMRCLTLADALRAQGAECQFICREHPGHLIELIRGKGHLTHALPVNAESSPQHAIAGEPAHSHWLGATQELDAAKCATILAELQPDWLVLDHYALDAGWEIALKQHYRKLMVIDDLADRPHQCDLLLDQTFGRDATDYESLVPAGCTLLCGSRYALLRPEFAHLRPYSLQRRAEPQLNHLLITMGGVDRDNATGLVLQALKSSKLPASCRITVVMGATAPWLAEVRQLAEQLPWRTDVLVNVSSMAQLMADSDLAIGAAGATSWERCCLGLPTIIVVLADNQRTVAQGLEQAGAVSVVQSQARIVERLPRLLDDLAFSQMRRNSMSRSAVGIVDGTGAMVMINYLRGLN